MLSRAEIQSRKIIDRYSDAGAKASTYDLCIDCIIDSKGATHYDNFTIHPQEVAWVVSREVVTLPKDITAFAHIKTGLCSSGLLALNTGIVDPGWSGPLATPILNFGKQDHLLRPGAEFLRVTFHTHNPVEDAQEVKKSRPEYLSEKQDSALHYFGEKFLNANAIVQEALRENVLKWAGAIALAASIFVAVTAIVLTLGAIVINSNAFYGPTFFSARAGELAPLQQRLDALEKELASIKLQRSP